MKSAGQQAPTTAPTTAPIGFQPNPSPFQPSVKLDLSKDDSKAYLKNLNIQQSVAVGTNSILSSIAMGLNYGIQSKYFDLQNKIANNQLDLGMRAMDLEGKKLDVARAMNSEQLTFQKSIARIQQQTQVTISRIQERGKTDRAEVFSAMNAFQRTNYYSGQPTFKLGAVS